MKFEDFINSEKALFHYTTKKVFFENINPTQELRLSPIGNMDDPKENRGPDFEYWTYGDKQNYNKKAENRFNEIILKEYKVACFCKNEKIKGYLRSRMWSQYGEKHEGVCVVFSRNAIDNIINNSFKFEEVKYKNNIPLSTDFMEHYLKEPYLEDTLNSFIEKKYKNIFFLKNNDYRDEVEFRLIKRGNDCKNIYEYLNISNCMTGLILGCNFNLSYLPLIDKVKEESKLKIRQCYYDNSIGALQIMEV